MSALIDLGTNYLVLQPLIEAQLRSELAADKIPVEGIEEIAQAGAEDQRPKVVFVCWAGDRFPQAESGRVLSTGAQLVYQQWLVMLHLRNAGQINRDARNAQAGQLLARLHRALSGWSPVSQPGSPLRFRRITGPKPDYTKVSGLYPLAFEIPLQL